MSAIEVHVITAFGRGESLALALKAQGFLVRVLDFSNALPPEYLTSGGPFPLPREGSLPEQTTWLAEGETLPRGLAFWLNEGPLELGGPLTPFYTESRADLKALDKPAKDFADDWLRRFLKLWASPYHRAAWDADQESSSFPARAPLVQVPAYDEKDAFGFSKVDDVIRCTAWRDVQFVGPRLSEISVEAGQTLALSADQWVWCLSGHETELLNADLAKRVFPRGTWKPDWVWLALHADCEAGPWLDGFPAHMVVIGDRFLPWTYANAMVVRRAEPEGFRLWVKIPAAADGVRRQEIADECEAALNARLALAKWTVRRDSLSVCPHSPVYESHHKDGGRPGHRNFEWIAPETLPRLDFGARLQREAETYRRLVSYRDDHLKKQGAPRDPALHTP